MLNKKTLVIALALALGTATGALAATKKPITANHQPLLSAAVAGSYASVPMTRIDAEGAWLLDRAKGNINGE